MIHKSMSFIYEPSSEPLRGCTCRRAVAAPDTSVSITSAARSSSQPLYKASTYWSHLKLITCSYLPALLLSSLDLSDTHVYEPYMRALLGTASHFCEVVVLKSTGSPRRAVLRRGSEGQGDRGARPRLRLPRLPPRESCKSPPLDGDSVKLVASQRAVVPRRARI